MTSIAHLSRLSRGRGEEIGSLVQVVYDDKDLESLNYPEFLHTPMEIRTPTPYKSITKNIPKTYSTRKGPLFLFSEDFFGKVDFLHNGSDISSKSRCISRGTPDESSQVILRTTRDLRASILAFGTDHIDNNNETPKFESGRDSCDLVFERQNTLTCFKIPKDIKSNDNIFEKIRPGYSAKRYLSNWSKHWSPQLFDSLFKGGKLCEETLYEPNEILPNIKHRIDDDLSRIPPAYRIQHNWLAFTVQPLRGYRFYRIANDVMGILDEEFGFNESDKDLVDDQIKVLDKDGFQVQYENLNKTEQKLLLTELLLQTALSHIAEKQVKVIEEKLHQAPHTTHANSVVDFVDDTKEAVPEKKIPIKHFNAEQFILNEMNPDGSKGKDPMYMFRSFQAKKLGDMKRKVLPPIQSRLNNSNQAMNPLIEITEAEAEYVEESPNKSLVHDLESIDITSTDQALANENEFLRYTYNGLLLPEVKSSSLPDKMEYQRYLQSSLDEDVQEIDHLTEYQSIGILNQELTEEDSNIDTVSARNKESTQNQTDNDRPYSGAVVLAPNGEVVKIGHTITTDGQKLLTKQKASDIVYRIPSELSPPIKRIDMIPKKTVSSKDSDSQNKDDEEDQLLNKDVMQALGNHAQQVAQLVLEQYGSGQNLEHDIKMCLSAENINSSDKTLFYLFKTAINENLSKIEYALKTGEINAKQFDEVNEIMKNSVKKYLVEFLTNSSDLNDVIFEDNTLEFLIRLPPSAFEIFVTEDNKRILRVKPEMEHNVIEIQPETTESQIELNLDKIHFEDEKSDNKLQQERTESTGKFGKKIGSRYIERPSKTVGNRENEFNLQKMYKKYHRLPKIDTQTTSDKDGKENEAEEFMFDAEDYDFDLLQSQVISKEPSKTESLKKTPEKEVKETTKEVKPKTIAKKLPPLQPIPKEEKIDKAEELRRLNEKKAELAKKYVKPKAVKKLVKKKVKRNEFKEPSALMKYQMSKSNSQEQPFKAGVEKYKIELSFLDPNHPEKVKGLESKPSKPKGKSKSKKSKKDSGSDYNVGGGIEASADVADTMIKEQLNEDIYDTTENEESDDKSADETKPNDERFYGEDDEGEYNIRLLSRADMPISGGGQEDEGLLQNALEARDQKRRLAAEEKRSELMRKRLEKEEQKKREEEQQAKRLKLAMDLEEEQKRRAEELRMRRVIETEKRRLEMEEEAEKERQLLIQQEIERKLKEEQERRLNEMRLQLMGNVEEQARLELLRLEELELKKRAQEELVQLLHEKEKAEFLKRRKEQEEELKRQTELEKQRRDEEVQRALEEVKRIAMEELMKKKEMERRLEFWRSVTNEANYFDFSQAITRAFIFSYFDLLRYLSSQIPLKYAAKSAKNKSKSSQND